MENLITISNLPKNLGKDENEIISLIKTKLSTLLEEYKILPGSGLTKLGFLAILNKDVKNSDKLNNKVFLQYHNYPREITPKQDIQDSIFRAKLNSGFINFDKHLNSQNLSKVSIIAVYNKEPDTIKIENHIPEKKSNEEDLTFFIPIKPKYSLDQVILKDELLIEIKQTLLILQKKQVLYDDWGFGEIEPSPKSIINFFGPPGTGKTMTAHAIAHRLNTNILSLNYSDIESKFVGDAPKNLARAFEMAEKEGSVLFFDEADSFLGKRITNVSSSSDQAVNSLRSQMLILLENFTGIVIFATNLLTNYDKAFESRIFKHLKFDNPDSKTREKIISKSIPSKVPLMEGPLNNETLEQLANLSEGFSGREIKNSILHSLSRALLQERDYVCLDDFIISFNKAREDRKMLSDEHDKFSINDSKKKELEMKISQNLKKANTETQSNARYLRPDRTCLYRKNLRGMRNKG